MIDEKRIKRDILRGSTWLTAEKISATILGLVYMTLLLRFVGPYNYGIFAVALAVIALSQIGTLNFESALARFIPEYEVKKSYFEIKKLIMTSFALKFILSSSITLLVFSLSKNIAYYYHIDQLANLLGIFSILIVVNSFNALINQSLFGFQYYKHLFILSAWNQVLGIIAVVVSIFFQYTLLNTGKMIVFANCIGAITGIFILFILLYQKSNKSNNIQKISNKKLLERVIPFILPLSVSMALYTIYLNIGKVILGYFFMPEIVGYFSFSMATVERIVGVVSRSNASLLPPMSQIHAQGNKKMLEKVIITGTRYISMIAFIFLVLIVIFSKELVILVGGAKYLPAVILLHILSFQILFRLPSQVLGTVFYVYEKTTTMMLVNLAKIVFELSAYLILIPLINVKGAVMAHVLGYILSFFISLQIVNGLIYTTSNPMKNEILKLSFKLLVLSIVAFLIAILLDSIVFTIGIFLKILFVIIYLFAVFILGKVITIDDIVFAENIKFNSKIINTYKDGILWKFKNIYLLVNGRKNVVKIISNRF